MSRSRRSTCSLARHCEATSSKLWTARHLPIKSILLVTHNIEEAVFMCDRILILASNPGHSAAEIVVLLPHPRDRLATAFRDVVDDIYSRMTAGPAPAVGNK